MVTHVHAAVVADARAVSAARTHARVYGCTWSCSRRCTRVVAVAPRSNDNVRRAVDLATAASTRSGPRTPTCGVHAVATRTDALTHSAHDGD
jgi:hypothetical protein